MKVSYDWLTEYLGESAPSAKEIEKLLTFHSFEIEELVEKDGDIVIDVDVLPNRSSDCLSHRGIAREIATITGQTLAKDPLREELSLVDNGTINVSIADREACPRFTASLITGIEVKESPEWLKKRLLAIGQRPINNIVDATNYVMFALGQPIHAYDADLFPQVDGKWQFGVRYATPGETISLIAEGGKDEDRIVELVGTEQLIIDESSNTPIGLAGVKGGRFAGVHAGTTKVIIEAAHFHPVVTRKTARRLGIVIDASKRFENEPSRELPPYAQAEVVKLIIDIAGGTYEGTIDDYQDSIKPAAVAISESHTNSLLGLQLDKATMSDILHRVGCEVEETDTGLTAIGPWERTDLNIEEDFIEEIGRIYGYQHVESVVPEVVPLTEFNARHYYSEQVREALLVQGFSEVITSSFRKKDEIQLANALSKDKSYLRSSLIKNVAEVLDKNATHSDLLGTPDTRVFEIGTVFNKSADMVSEHVSLCIGVRLKSSGYTGKEDKILAAATEAVSKMLGVDITWHNEKGVAEMNLTELIVTMTAPNNYSTVSPAPAKTYRPFSSYPAVARDISLWVKEDTSSEEVIGVLNTEAGPLWVRTTLFDEFTKDGKTSYALRLVFQSHEKTLTDEEVNSFMDNIYQAVQALGWEVR